MGLKAVSKNTEEKNEVQVSSAESSEPDWFMELVEASDKDREELTQLVEEKMNEFPGLVSHGSACILVGRDLGYQLEDLAKPELEVGNLVPGMGDVEITVSLTRKTDVNHYSGGKVANWIVSDGSGRTQVAFFDDDVDGLYQEFEEGDRLRITGGYTGSEVSDYQKDNFGGVPAIKLGDDVEVEKVE